MNVSSLQNKLKDIDDSFVSYFHTLQGRKIKHLIKIFSINPKLVYIFFLIVNFVYLNNSILKNIVLFVVCDILIFLLKRVIKRSRPEEFSSSTLKKLSGLGPDKYSFPSAHTFTAFQIVPISFMSFGVWGILILVYACMVAFSRIFLKHHYFTDVLGGAFIGLILGLLNIIILK